MGLKYHQHNPYQRKNVERLVAYSREKRKTFKLIFLQVTPYKLQINRLCIPSSFVNFLFYRLYYGANNVGGVDTSRYSYDLAVGACGVQSGRPTRLFFHSGQSVKSQAEQVQLNHCKTKMVCKMQQFVSQCKSCEIN